MHGKSPEPGQFIEVEDARLFYRVVGRGTPLVVLHGGPGLSHDYLYPQLTSLLTSNYRLIFYDQRASGRSTGVKNPLRLTMAQFVEDLEQVREALALEKLNLLGHSFGGLLAMYYAAAYPLNLNKLILLDSDAASWALRTPYQERIIAERRTKQDEQEMAAIEATSGASGTPEAIEKMFKISLRPYFYARHLADELVLGFDEQSLANHAVTSQQVRRDLGRYDIHERLSRITSPTLIIHGAASIFSVEGAEAIHQRLPNSRLVLLKDVGHFA